MSHAEWVISTVDAMGKYPETNIAKWAVSPMVLDGFSE